MKKESKKLTKKQKRRLEKQRKLEEEIKKKEEEEKRAKEEDEKRHRDLLIKKEKKKKYREEEKKRLQLEEKKYFSVYLEISKLKEKVIREFKAEKEWKEYLKCENKYNIEKKMDLNLMIVLLKENKLENYEDLEEILEKIQNSEKIIEELEERILELKTQKTKNYREYEDYIEEIILVNKIKINQICNFIMQKTEKIISEKLKEEKNKKTNIKSKKSDKPEILLIYKKKLIKLGFWIMGFENGGRGPKTIDYKELNLLSDIPKAFFSKRLVMIVKQFSHNYIDRKNFNKKLPKLRIIHTVSELGCYKYLSDSKESSKYILKRYYNLNEDLETIKDTTSNFKIYINLPNSLFLLSSDLLEFMFWKEEDQIWTKEGIGGVKKEFKKEKDKNFYAVSIPKMAPIAVMGNYNAEIPYQNFKIRRIGYRTILFNVETRRISLEFEITPGYVELVKIKNKQLSRFANQKLSPQKILLELKKSNIFLIPEIDYLSDGIRKKLEDVEVFTLREITKACLYYHVQLSSWNSFVNEKSLILRIRENPENDEKFHEDSEIDWHTIQFKTFKCKLLKILENSESFSKEKEDKTLSHLNLYFLINTYKDKFIQNYYDENFIEEEILLIDTIYKLLQPMHLFALCY